MILNDIFIEIRNPRVIVVIFILFLLNKNHHQYFDIVFNVNVMKPEDKLKHRITKTSKLERSNKTQT